MSGLYSLWDMIEDLIKNHIEESDASRFAELPGMQILPSRLWGVIWLLFSVFTVFLAVILALLIFNKGELNNNQEVEENWELLPTHHIRNNSSSNSLLNNDDNFGFGVI